MKGAGLLLIAVFVVGAAGCDSAPQSSPSPSPLSDSVVVLYADDEIRLCAEFCRTLELLLESANASEFVKVEGPSDPEELPMELKELRSEVVVLIGLKPKAQKEAVNAAIGELDYLGTKVFTILSDFPETRRRAFFDFDPGGDTRVNRDLAELAARQIVAAHVHKRQISTFQQLQPSPWRIQRYKP